jgi:hypothetical protein
MSLINDASLILTPNAISAGKLYSIIPTNGNGDMTVVRGTNATRINSAGLVEIPRTNLCLRSEEFNDVTWIKTNGATITANSEISPIGILNADLMTATAAFAQVQTTPTVVIGVSYTVSMWIKRISGTGQVYLRSIENVSTPITITNEWVRYSVTTTATSTIGRIGVQLLVSGDSVAVWGAQLETSNVATEYIPTVASIRTSFSGITQDGASASNIARLNYDTVGGCPAILIEPQRTNLDPTSQTFSSWTLNNSGGVTTSSVSTTNPYEFSTVSKVIPSAILGQHRPFLSTNYSSTGRFWVIAKADGYNFLSLGDGGGVAGASIIFNLSNGTISGTASGYTGEITSFGNGWYKCSINTVFTGLTGRWVIIRNANSTADYIGDGTSGILFAHKQMEVGSYDTSSIPTLGSAITRNSDSLTRANIFTNNLITSAGGTWFVHLRNNIPLKRDASTPSISIDTSSLTNGFSIKHIDSTSTLRLSIIKLINGVQTPLFLTTTDNVKIAIKWNGTTADIFQNGVKVITATAFTTTAMQNLSLLGTDVPKSINSTMLFPTPLTDTECISMTQL